MRFLVSLDSAGTAMRAELEKASGDQLVDEDRPVGVVHFHDLLRIGAA